MAKRASRGEYRPYRRKEDGLWVVAVRDVDNKRRCLYASTRAGVLTKRDDYMAALRVGLSPATGRLTVGRHLQDWLESKRPPTVRQSTWISYEGIVRIHLASLARIPLAKLTPNDVRRLGRERLDADCSERTVNYVMTILRMALHQAVRDGLVPRNVASLAERPRVARNELTIWQPTEARRFLAATSASALGPLWALLLATGMRLGEGLGLRSSDIDFAGRSVTVSGSLRPVPRQFRDRGPDGSVSPRLVRLEPKTNAAWRTVSVPGFAFSALERHRDRTETMPSSLLGLFFTSPRGTPLDPRNVSRTFEKDVAISGVPRIRIHDLRHTAASLMIAQGFALDDVKRVLGHSSIAMTSDVYGHLVEGRSRELADRINRVLGDEAM
jgi:integrase